MEYGTSEGVDDGKCCLRFYLSLVCESCVVVTEHQQRCFLCSLVLLGHISWYGYESTWKTEANKNREKKPISKRTWNLKTRDDTSTQLLRGKLTAKIDIPKWHDANQNFGTAHSTEDVVVNETLAGVLLSHSGFAAKNFIKASRSRGSGLLPFSRLLQWSEAAA